MVAEAGGQSVTRNSNYARRLARNGAQIHHAGYPFRLGVD
jgi:hypothetical protein